MIDACDRCGDDNVALYPVPDLFADQYARVCEACEQDLERHERHFVNFGKGDE